MEYEGQFYICTRNQTMVPFKGQKGQGVFVLCCVGQVAQKTRRHVGQHQASLEILSDRRTWSCSSGGCIRLASGHQTGDQESEGLTTVWAPPGGGKGSLGVHGRIPWRATAPRPPDFRSWSPGWATGELLVSKCQPWWPQRIYVWILFLALVVVPALPQVWVVVARTRPQIMLELSPNRALVAGRKGDCLSQPVAAGADPQNNWGFWKPAKDVWVNIWF